MKPSRPCLQLWDRAKMKAGASVGYIECSRVCRKTAVWTPTKPAPSGV